MRKKKIFWFHINNWNRGENVQFFFFPEKYKLLSSISSEKKGCELNRYKISESSDIILTADTSVKNITPLIDVSSKTKVST